MVQITNLGVLLALIVPALGTGGMQINYYYDGGCTEWASTPPEVPDYSAGGYNWAIEGSNSANIANCFHELCECYFFTGRDLQGERQYATNLGQNCASAWGQGFQSFICSYYDYKPPGQGRYARTVQGNL